MLVSLEWLKAYVRLPDDLSPEQIMHDLTLATVEVEGVAFPAERLTNVVLAEVVSAEPVPGTKLSDTRVNAGAHGEIAVVCGAPNVRAGLFVALALPGARIVPRGQSEPLVVSAAQVRGMDSHAVICSADEIGVAGVFPEADESGILELVELADAAPGTPLAELIGFDDAVFEIDNKSLTNRPDLWGHHGLARELAAIYGAPLTELPERPQVPASDTLLTTSDETVCNRFTATVFDNVTVSQAPLYMRSRLARVGQRAIDLFVDLTNYVMFAVGQPSHAYDADAVEAPMCARRGEAGETVTLLDGSEITSHAAAPFIADARQPLAVAGVMGGEASGVTHSTQRIFLEMANFDARVVRAASQHTGARTEASTRFEKALDTQRIDAGLGLFHALLREIQPEAQPVAFQDSGSSATSRAQVAVTHGYITSRLGVAFEPSAIRQSLETLGFSVELDGDVFRVTAPTWRSTGDVSLPADIVEEVARLHGYDNFRFVAPRIDLQHLPRPRRLPLDRQVRELLAQAGMQEVFTYPWCKDALLEAAAAGATELMALEMPPAPDQGRLRPALVPNLLEAAVTNLRYFDQFGLFEVGGVYPATGEQTSAAGVLVGGAAAESFRELRGVFEHVERRAQIRDLVLRASQDDHDWADPTAQLAILRDGERVGTLGRVSNRSKRLAGIDRAEVMAFELRLNGLEAHPTRENTYQRVPEYPQSWFDISVVLADAVSWAAVEALTAELDPLLRAVRWVGEYRGKGVPEGHRSLTLRLLVGSAERTLVSEEAEAVRARVLEALEKNLGARQR